MLSPNPISQETIDRSKRFMHEVVGDASEFENKDWWLGQLGFVGLVIDWVENGERSNGKPKRIRVIAKPGDKGRVARTLKALDKALRWRVEAHAAISTAELDAMLEKELGFVASTSTQISKLRAWYKSQGLGKIRRIDTWVNSVRVCRYWLEKASA